MTIIVFCPNLIGDTVMATPALRALRLGSPDARIVGVIKPHVSPTLDGAPWLDDRILFHPKSADTSQRTRAVVARLREERPEMAVLLPNSFRSALMAWRSGARRRVGYARGGRSILLTDRLEPLRDRSGTFVPTPIVESYLAIARKAGGAGRSLRTELFTTEGDEQAADRAWEALGLVGDSPVVCLNTGGAFGPAKNWPVGHFSALACRLADEAGVKVLVVCGPGERDAAREIEARAGHPRVVSLADQPLSIGLTKASVRRSALLITTDSGPRHFAAPFDVPAITLFGPTHIAWTRTYHPRAIHLAHPVPCGPCQRPTCALGHHRCMTELTPQSVFDAALRVLGGRPDRPARASLPL